MKFFKKLFKVFCDIFVIPVFDYCIKNSSEFKKLCNSNKDCYINSYNNLKELILKIDNLKMNLDMCYDYLVYDTFNNYLYNDIYIYIHNKLLHLYKRDNGKINFLPTPAAFLKSKLEKLPHIFIRTLPKSGTYLMARILCELGYEDIEIHSSDCSFSDYRNHSLYEKLNCAPDYEIKLPFEIQSRLIENGQFLLGHFSYNCAKFISGDHLIVCIRDLRFVCFSFLRFLQRRKYHCSDFWFNLGETEEALYAFMNSNFINDLRYHAQESIKFIEAYPNKVIKFEDLNNISNNKYVVDVISATTNVDNSLISIAINESLNKKTLTYSGKTTRIDDVWSDRIEHIFCKSGLNILNSDLGYKQNI